MEESSGKSKVTDPVEVVREGAEAMRAYNHLTIEKGGFESAPRVSAAVQALVTMVQRMPQGLEQTRWAVGRFAAGGQIRMDDGSEPAEAAEQVEKILGAAEKQAQALAATLEQAAGVLFHMGAPHTADEDDDEDW